MKTSFKLSFICFVLIFALILPSCSAEVTTAPALNDAVEVSYDTAFVTRGDLKRTTLYEAYVRATVEELSFVKSNGVFGELLVGVGDSVKKGDILAIMDTSAFTASIESAHAALKAHEEKLIFNRRQKQIDIELAKLDLDDAQNGGSETDILLAEFTITRLEAEFRQINELGALETANFRKQLQTAEAALNDTEIIAPFDGEVVGVTQKAAGQRISSTENVILLADKSRLYVQFDGTDSISTSRGRFSALIGANEYKLIPVVYEHSEYVSLILSGRKPVPQFLFDAQPEGVSAGDFAALLYIEGESADALMVPVNALYYGSGKNYVYAIENGEKVYTEISIGLRNGAFVEITAGLEEGVEVFVKQ